jgi:hypothetical protein
MRWLIVDVVLALRWLPAVPETALKPYFLTFGVIFHYPPIKTMVREGGTKPGSLMRWPSSFSLTTERM